MSEEIKETQELRLNEIDVHKLNVQPGDVLMLALKNDDIGYDDLVQLRKMFAKAFPNNQMFLLNVGSQGDMRFSIVSQAKTSYSCSDEQSPGYCSDCNCGKKEQIEAERNSK